MPSRQRYIRVVAGCGDGAGAFAMTRVAVAASFFAGSGASAFAGAVTGAAGLISSTLACLSVVGAATRGSGAGADPVRASDVARVGAGDAAASVTGFAGASLGASCS